MFPRRPARLKAIAHAKRAQAILVIAKLDRLVRSTIAMAAFKSSKVKFVACDNPMANELTIDILVAVADDEARRISERTTAALAAYKARGGLSGGSRPESQPESRPARREPRRLARRAATRPTKRMLISCRSCRSCARKG
jgi:DNA invertase Pin-like site-specific DNA recombinase